MRSILTASVIALWAAAPAWGFEIEAETNFPAPDATTTLRIISTTDTGVFAPLIESFQAENPQISITYVEASSAEINRAVIDEAAVFDVVISSAMDLQVKLANDGYAARFASEATARVPDWGQWRGSVFAFTQEPAVIVLSTAAFAGIDMPRTRLDLISLLRDRPDLFQGRVGTYDVRASGLGYLFATQESRTSELFWRLTELMGQRDVRLYCCSSDMIEDVSRGDIAIAYNVLGSYASARGDLTGSVTIIEPEDYATVMLRSAVILSAAPNKDEAALFVDHLLADAWGPGDSALPFPNPRDADTAQAQNMRRIPLGPGLLVFLDRLKRAQFLAQWESAIAQ